MIAIGKYIGLFGDVMGKSSGGAARPFKIIRPSIYYY